MQVSEVVSALNRKLFHISDHRVVRQLVESLTEVALKLIMHETSILDLVEKVPVVRFASIAGKSIYWMVPGFLFTATVAAKAPVAGPPTRSKKKTEQKADAAPVRELWSMTNTALYMRAVVVLPAVPLWLRPALSWG